MSTLNFSFFPYAEPDISSLIDSIFQTVLSNYYLIRMNKPEFQDVFSPLFIKKMV